MELYEQTGGNVIAVEQCDPTETNKYGIVGKGQRRRHGLCRDRNGREARAGGRSLQLLHQRPLHAAARSVRAPRHAGARRRQRDPADGCDAAACRQTRISCPSVRGTHVRLRLEGRLHPGECRLRAGRATTSATSSSNRSSRNDRGAGTPQPKRPERRERRTAGPRSGCASDHSAGPSGDDGARNAFSPDSMLDAASRPESTAETRKWRAAPARIMNQRNFPLNGRISMASGGYGSLHRPGAAGRDRRAAGKGRGAVRRDRPRARHRLSRLHAARNTRPRRASCSTTA